MATTQQRPKLVAIVGPTASGKSELAMRIAKEFNGEIIAADSRTIYKGMDIGTAKPTEKNREEVAHWGIDLVEPGEAFSAYKFKKFAEKAITDIQNRGKLAILVGGTGLYIDSVLFDFSFSSPANPRERKKLEGLATDALRRIIEEKGYPMPSNHQNRRHLIRAIEKKGYVDRKGNLNKKVLIIGLWPDDEVIKANINERASEYFKEGLVGETKRLLANYGEATILNSGGIAYSAALKLLRREIDQNAAIEEIKKNEWQYARRQRTWFRRHKFIQWFNAPGDAFASVSKQLNK